MTGEEKRVEIEGVVLEDLIDGWARTGGKCQRVSIEFQVQRQTTRGLHLEIRKAFVIPISGQNVDEEGLEFD